MGNSVLVVSGYFKKDTTTTAADKMARVLEAEAAATSRCYTGADLSGMSRGMEKAATPGSVTAGNHFFVQCFISCTKSVTAYMPQTKRIISSYALKITDFIPVSPQIANSARSNLFFFL